MAHFLLAFIYVAFISLGLPDSLLGASWPMMYEVFGVNVSMAGVISVIISCGTVVSSLFSDRVTRKLGAGLVTIFSVAMTAGALLGFSVSTRFWMLCLMAVPYGLGAGSIDAALNNYVAVHYASRHMSWLHCMWGIGASVGPYIIGACLTSGGQWSAGYQAIGFIQLGLTAFMLFSLPLWRKTAHKDSPAQSEPLSLLQVIRIPGAKAIFIAFFCYCAVECTLFLWTSSYLVLHREIDEVSAATYAGLFYFGMTAGRALNGFLTIRLRDAALIRIGSAIMILGIGILLIPGGQTLALIGLLTVGLGCAPIYPCIIHSTPEIFGADRSQAVIGVQMAAAYLGGLLMPPVFGLIANHIHIALFPVYLCIFTLAMILAYRIMCQRTMKNGGSL